MFQRRCCCLFCSSDHSVEEKTTLFTCKVKRMEITTSPSMVVTNPTVKVCTIFATPSGGKHSGSASGLGLPLEKNTAAKVPALLIFRKSKATLTLTGANMLKWVALIHGCDAGHRVAIRHSQPLSRNASAAA